MMIRDITTFHRRVFVPAQTTIIAVGDGAHEALAGGGGARVRGLVRRRAGDPVARSRIPIRRHRRQACSVALVHRAGAAQSELRIGHVALSRKSPDYHAALVANMVLGGQFVSRINMNLREDKGYTYGVRTAFEFRRAPGPFVLHASVQADATADAAPRGDRRDARDPRRPTDHPRRSWSSDARR